MESRELYTFEEQFLIVDANISSDKLNRLSEVLSKGVYNKLRGVTEDGKPKYKNTTEFNEPTIRIAMTNAIVKAMETNQVVINDCYSPIGVETPSMIVVDESIGPKLSMYILAIDTNMSLFRRLTNKLVSATNTLTKIKHHIGDIILDLLDVSICNETGTDVAIIKYSFCDGVASNHRDDMWKCIEDILIQYEREFVGLKFVVYDKLQYM